MRNEMSVGKIAGGLVIAAATIASAIWLPDDAQHVVALVGCALGMVATAWRVKAMLVGTRPTMLRFPDPVALPDPVMFPDPLAIAMARINEARLCYRRGNVDEAITILDGMHDLPALARKHRAYLRAEIDALRGELASAELWLKTGRRLAEDKNKHKDKDSIEVESLMAEALLCAARQDRAAFVEVFAKIDASEVGYHGYHVLEFLAEHLARHGNGDATWQLAPMPVDATNPLLAIVVSRWPMLEERNDSRL